MTVKHRTGHLAMRSLALALLLVIFMLVQPAQLAARNDAAQAEKALTTETEAGPPKPVKLFKSEQVLSVSIRAPWLKIIRDPENQGAYPATIDFTDSLGRSNSIPLTVERRGLTRQVVCKNPPIKLRFNKEDVSGTLFRGQKSLKMVTHCDKGTRWEQYYVKEFLAYKMYKQITELSFRVRPLSITYIDSDKGSKDGPRFAFIIEDLDDVAKRNGLEELDIAEIDPAQLQAQEASRFALFQYMISNVDFEATAGPDEDKCCHNAKLIGSNPEENIYSIPYDFDSSGMVDTHYAAPNEALPIRYVTQRLYRGFCADNHTLEAARQEFLAKQADITGLVSNEQMLTKGSRKSVLKFLNPFWETLQDPTKFNRDIIQKCRK